MAIQCAKLAVTYDMWLVGYLHNSNGMGTWCWEAAHALAEAGEPVTLVCSDTVALPGPTTVPIMRVAAAPRAVSTIAKLGSEWRRMSHAGPRVMYDAVQRLEREGTVVRVVLLNATEFYDPRIAALQVVTAWARGITLRAYAARLRVHLRGLSLQSVRSVTDAFGWWRKDWRAFHGADIIAAVTSPLVDELRAHGVAAELLHPCTDAAMSPPATRARGAPVRLLMAAASLDEPRKRVAWMLHALRGLSPDACTLTLVGDASAALRREAEQVGMATHFTGSLSRDDVISVMREHDMFLFGSVLDDWGFVVTEAMGQGLAVVAPDLAPFDEIIADAGVLYAATDPPSFRRAVLDALPRADFLRLASWSRARSRFAREAFVHQLRQIVAVGR